MTTVHPIEQQCAVCGTTDKYILLTSTNSFGVPDLDTRPPEMMRSTIGLWVQRCGSCGYCAPDITKGSPALSTVIHSVPYQTQLRSPDFPELANSFLCWSLIQQDQGDFASAGWASLRAAWACDDTGDESAAVQCRLRAANLLQKARQVHQTFASQSGAEEALLADILRRAGQFDGAIQICDAGLAKESALQPVIVDILDLQKRLIRKADTACHQVREA